MQKTRGFVVEKKKHKKRAIQNYLQNAQADKRSDYKLSVNT